MSKRALHFVFKSAERKLTAYFFRNILGMKFLRHEEFEEGCKASCNGPYDGKWSKSMVGFGPEDNHFVIELTYNYGVGSYPRGNDFRGITVWSKQAIVNAKREGWPGTQEGDVYTVEAPGGYQFHIKDQERSGDADPVEKVTLSCSNLKHSVDYWSKLCGMTVYNESKSSATLGYTEEQCKLELLHIEKPVEHAKAFGRIAFSCPSSELPALESNIRDDNKTVLTPLVSLDTPGKATVQVVILADPDGHEICFVGDEAFRELSQIDPEADHLLNEAISADKSDEWFSKKGRNKPTA